MGELLIVLAIVVLLFGASKLPQLGEGVGKAIRGLKRGLRDDDLPSEQLTGGDSPATEPAALHEGEQPR